MSVPVVFLSDFGLADEFVGVVHGVIAKLSPHSPVIDLTHGVPRGDVRAGALSLLRAIQYMPEGVVLAVVDPGVGTARRGIVAVTERGPFVGPDNGLLSPAVALAGGASRMFAIENPDFRIHPAGATFDGRDVFAPAAAVLASGEAEPEDLGPELGPEEVVPLILPLPEPEPGRATGEAWWVDSFGNVQTNLAPADLELAGLAPGDVVGVRVGSSVFEAPWVATYGSVPEGGLLLHVDSVGLVALAVRGGRADEALGLGVGAAVTLVPREPAGP